MNFFKRYPIKNVFFISFSLFIVVGLVVIIFASYRLSVNEIVKMTSLHQERNLELLKDDLQSKLELFESNTIVLSRQRAFQEVIRNHTSYYEQSSLTIDFSNLIYSISALHSIEIYMNNPPVNNLQYPVRYYPLPDNDDTENHTDWFKKMDKSVSKWIGHKEVETISGVDSVISHARIINDSRGEIQAILLLNLDPLVLQSWFKRYSGSTNVSLLDENGVNLVHTISSSTELNQQEHKKDLIVTLEMAPYNWTLVEKTPYKELTQSSKNMGFILLLIGVILTFFALIGTRFLTNFFTGPILQLTELMKSYKLSQGKAVIPEGYSNEFSHLFNGYRDLIERSESLYNSLIKQHKRQRNAEIKALQANINPHFLYNTLDQLNWSAIEYGYDDMSKMLELLGKMLRIGLSSGESIITMKDEITYLNYYLQIQKIQMEGRLQCDFDVSDEVLNYFIPKLTFQPFFENAIIHGFQGRKKGKVGLEIEEAGDYLVIKILDDGVGSETFERKPSKFQTGGYGIRNVVERLDVYFGRKAKVTIQNRKEGGTIVRIEIPKVTEREFTDDKNGEISNSQ